MYRVLASWRVVGMCDECRCGPAEYEPVRDLCSQIQHPATHIVTRSVWGAAPV